MLTNVLSKFLKENCKRQSLKHRIALFVGKRAPAAYLSVKLREKNANFAAACLGTDGRLAATGASLLPWVVL